MKTVLIRGKVDLNGGRVDLSARNNHLLLDIGRDRSEQQISQIGFFPASFQKKSDMKGIGFKVKELNEKKINILLGLLIILQLVVVVYWGNNKANYYIDELYAKGYASSFTGKGGKGGTSQYITNSQDWKFGEWIKNSELKKYIVVSEEESVFNAEVGATINRFITGRLYYGLLNIMESIFGRGIVSAWPGIILNSSILVLTDIALIILLKRLRLQRISIILAFIMYGFSGYILGITEFIRFYSIVILLLLLLWSTLIRLWVETNIRKTGLYVFFMGVIIYFSYKQSELTVFYACSLLFIFTISLLLTKKHLKALLLLVIEAIGFIYLYFKTSFIDILIHIDAYSSDLMPVNYINNILKADLPALKKNLVLFKYVVNHYFFGNQILSVVTASLLIACVIYRLIEGKKSRDICFLRGKQRIIDTIITLTGLLCWIIASLTTKEEILWISLVTISVCLLLYVVLHTLDNRKIDAPKDNLYTVFIGLLAITTIPYVVLVSLSGYTATRYFCFAIVSVMIGLWCMIDKLVMNISATLVRKVAYICFTVCVMFAVISPFSNRNIEYIYEDEKEFNARIEEYSDLPVVNAFYARHDLYDCVYRIGDDTEIFFIDYGAGEYEAKELPSSFILWSHRLAKLEWLTDELTEKGYKVSFLGENHVSQAYLCKQK